MVVIAQQTELIDTDVLVGRTNSARSFISLLQPSDPGPGQRGFAFCTLQIAYVYRAVRIQLVVAP